MAEERNAQGRMTRQPVDLLEHPEQHAALARPDLTELEALLRGDAERPRSAAAAGRGLRVLAELGLVAVDPGGRSVSVPAAVGRTALEHSPAFRAYERRYEDGVQWLSGAAARAA